METDKVTDRKGEDCSMPSAAKEDERKKWALTPADYSKLEPDWRRSMLRLQQWAIQYGFPELAAS